MNNLEILAIVISVFAALIALGTAVQAKRQANSAEIQAIASQAQADAAETQAALAEKQLAELQKKIGMVTKPEMMFEVLPTWYVKRMSTDEWGFGLLLTSSDVLAITRIEGISTDGKWLEVSMMERGSGPQTVNGVEVVYAPTDRLRASVRIDTIAAAFEIWTS